jgi:hypothetical protein
MKSLALIALLAAPSLALAASPDVVHLASHPQCIVADGTLLVRGAVIDEPGATPVAGAEVTLRTSSGARLRGRTDASGVYVATSTAKVAPGDTVREVATSVPAPLGTLMPVQARQAGGVCSVAAVSIGPILR